jgi:thermitase
VQETSVYSAAVIRRLGLIVLVFVLAGLAAVPAGADPNDPYWGSEWGPRLTRASDLWQLTTGNPSVVIAVVDTGLSPLPVPDMTHVVPGWDILGNDSNTTDTFGHGTWVSSIIGALGNNGVGIAGYCWNCSIMPVRVAAGHEGGVAGNIAAGIRWAVDHGARIVNVSLASNQFDEDELGAVEYAQSHGVLVVASAGNTGGTGPIYPAYYGTAWNNVLSVTGTDENDQLYSWATRGSWVELTAPGCEELLDENVGAAYGCGSSFAPPAVSGIAGLLFSLDPGLTVAQVAQALEATSHPVAGVGGGRIDAWAAAHYLGLAPATPPPPPAPPAPPPPPTPTVSPQVLVTTGFVRRSTTFSLQLDPGRLELQLTGPAAKDCSMSVRIAGSLYVDLPGERNVRTLAATINKGGAYQVAMRCASVNRKNYEFTATAMFAS